MMSACALPVTVKHTDPEVAQRRLTSTVLTTGDLSIASENTLRRYFLTQRFEDAPAYALVELHAAAVRNGDQNALFALSELSFYHARDTGQQSYYLASAVYAYAFLFPDGVGTPPNPIDPRLRVACDFYNRSLALTHNADCPGMKEVVARGGEESGDHRTPEKCRKQQVARLLLVAIDEND
jgi:hypothetical protein